MEFYRVYNMDAAGEAISFKGFPAADDSDACAQALGHKVQGKWHAMELWAGCDSIDCSDLSHHGIGRRVSTQLA